MRQPIRLPDFYKVTADGRIEKQKLSGRNKFNAHKTERDGRIFDSKSESNRGIELERQAQAGLITDLEYQPEFILQEAFRDNQGKHQRAIKYRADFAYTEQDQRIIEDWKGFETEAFKLKRKMFLFRYPELILRIQK